LKAGTPTFIKVEVGDTYITGAMVERYDPDTTNDPGADPVKRVTCQVQALWHSDDPYELPSGGALTGRLVVGDSAHAEAKGVNAAGGSYAFLQLNDGALYYSGDVGPHTLAIGTPDGKNTVENWDPQDGVEQGVITTPLSFASPVDFPPDQPPVVGPATINLSLSAEAGAGGDARGSRTDSAGGNVVGKLTVDPALLSVPQGAGTNE